MKMLFILLAFVGLLAAAELPVEVMGVPYFSGCNCKADSTPNTMEIGLSIHNPSSRSLQLSYQWYNPENSSYVEGGKVFCTGGAGNLPPNVYDACRIYLFTMTGGLNGTSKTRLKITGRSDIEEYTKVVEVEINYHTSPYENNIVARMADVEYAFQQLTAELDKSCYRGVCCGMMDVHNLAYYTVSNLSKANSSLRACQLYSAWDYVMNASNAVSRANQSYINSSYNCSNALSVINSTGLRIASVAGVILEGKKCGSEVAASESSLRGANSSLEEAKQALLVDDYPLTFSKLSSANRSIVDAVASIGKCPAVKPNETVVPPAGKNTTNESSDNSTPPASNNALLIAGGVVVAFVIIAAAALVLLFFYRRAQPVRKLPPAAPPSAPPSLPPQAPPAPEMHEDLEKEFNEWLESHSQKK